MIVQRFINCTEVCRFEQLVLSAMNYCYFCHITIAILPNQRETGLHPLFSSNWRGDGQTNSVSEVCNYGYVLLSFLGNAVLRTGQKKCLNHARKFLTLLHRLARCRASAKKSSPEKCDFITRLQSNMLTHHSRNIV